MDLEGGPEPSTAPTHVLAGYRVITRATRTDFQSPLLPPTPVSASDCVAAIAESTPEWQDWFPTRADAESARRASPIPDLHVLAVGFPETDLPHLLAHFPEPVWATIPDSLPARLARREPLPPSTPLGYELIGHDHGGWHTWLCIGDLVDEVHRATGVRPGPHGLIPTQPDARRAATWLTASTLGDPKVSFWTPALIAA